MRVPEAIEPMDDEKPQRANSKGLIQAYELRELAHKEAMHLNECAYVDGETPTSRAQAIAALIRAWDVPFERIRVIKGRGKPKNVTAVNDPSLAGKKPRAPIAPITPAA
jgi:hypothetical protein